MSAPSLVLFRAAAAVLADDPNHLGNKADNSCSCTSQLTVIVGYIAWAVTAIAILTLIGVGTRWTISTRSGNAQQENLDSLGKWGMGALVAGAAGQIGNAIFGFSLFTPHPQAIPGLSVIQHALNVATEIGIAVAIIGIILTGGFAMLRHRNGEPLGEQLVYVLSGCLLIAGASTITYAVLPW